MEHSFLCVLEFFLLMTLHCCAHAGVDIIPNITATPSWLSPGAPVTLNCSIGEDAAGWRFLWYKGTTKQVHGRFKYEELPGSGGGTDNSSFIVHGQTHTTRYKCKAVKKATGIYSNYSKPVFVWSDCHSGSVNVYPDQAQHFCSDDISLNCPGDPTMQVWRLTQGGHLSNSSVWGTVAETVHITNYSKYTAVYWCESPSGQTTNAVNITVQRGNITLVSPAGSVTEGASVTLGCKLRTKMSTSHVIFYHNDRPIQNDTTAELKIENVSKSHEGFYKCKHSKDVSLQSWVAVKSACSVQTESSFLLPVIVGFVCTTALIALLLLIRRGLKGARSQQSQDSTPYEVATQSTTQPRGRSSQPQGVGESTDVTYSVIQHSNIRHNGRSFPVEAEESHYAQVKVRKA